VIKNATHDQDVAAELVKIAEEHYEGVEEADGEEKIIKISPSQKAALDAAKAKEEEAKK